jgi:hypothetical protein
MKKCRPPSSRCEPAGERTENSQVRGFGRTKTNKTNTPHVLRLPNLMTGLGIYQKTAFSKFKGWKRRGELHVDAEDMLRPCPKLPLHADAIDRSPKHRPKPKKQRGWRKKALGAANIIGPFGQTCTMSVRYTVSFGRQCRAQTRRRLLNTKHTSR